MHGTRGGTDIRGEVTTVFMVDDPARSLRALCAWDWAKLDADAVGGGWFEPAMLMAEDRNSGKRRERVKESDRE